MYFLLFHDFQKLHGAGLYADTASDTLAGGTFLGRNHDLHGAGFHALTAGGAKLLVDHINTGLGILGDGTDLTNLCTLAALNADHRLGSTILFNDPNAGQILMEFLIKRLGASSDTLQTSHALNAFFNSELLHKRKFSFIHIFLPYYTPTKSK